MILLSLSQKYTLGARATQGTFAQIETGGTFENLGQERQKSQIIFLTSCLYEVGNEISRPFSVASQATEEGLFQILPELHPAVIPADKL